MSKFHSRRQKLIRDNTKPGEASPGFISGEDTYRISGIELAYLRTLRDMFSRPNRDGMCAELYITPANRKEFARSLDQMVERVVQRHTKNGF